jgi:two-component system OmpR family sensor kinase
VRLRTRIALLVALGAGLALVCMAALVVPTLQGNLERERLERLGQVVPLATEALKRGYDGSRRTDAVNAAVLISNARVVVYSVGPRQPRWVQDSLGGSSTEATPAARDLVLVAATGRGTTGLGHYGANRSAMVAVPFVSNAGAPYVALFAEPIGDVRGSVAFVTRRIVIGGVIALVLVLGIAAIASEVLARRLRRLRAAADRIAGGRFDEPVIDDTRDEIGDLARSFEQMRVRLDRLDRARREFIANASHELRTPLTSIGGFVELLEEGDLDAATQAEFLATVREQVERLRRLASDLLDLSRLDADEGTIETVPIDLRETVEACVAEARPLAGRRGSHLRAIVSPLEAQALGDDVRVHQIVRALVDNALRHTPAGSAITVMAAAAPWEASVSVRDDGPGIPPEALERVFERFYRGPGAAAQGSGLGLAIARELAQRMGGSLQARSAPGETVFTLTLRPAPPTPRAPMPAASATA